MKALDEPLSKYELDLTFPFVTIPYVAYIIKHKLGVDYQKSINELDRIYLSLIKDYDLHNDLEKRIALVVSTIFGGLSNKTRYFPEYMNIKMDMDRMDRYLFERRGGSPIGQVLAGRIINNTSNIKLGGKFKSTATICEALVDCRPEYTISEIIGRLIKDYTREWTSQAFLNDLTDWSIPSDIDIMYNIKIFED